MQSASRKKNVLNVKRNIYILPLRVPQSTRIAAVNATRWTEKQRLLYSVVIFIMHRTILFNWMHNLRNGEWVAKHKGNCTCSNIRFVHFHRIRCRCHGRHSVHHIHARVGNASKLPSRLIAHTLSHIHTQTQWCSGKWETENLLWSRRPLVIRSVQLFATRHRCHHRSDKVLDSSRPFFYSTRPFVLYTHWRRVHRPEKWK